jgi:hypothetical protein
MRKSGLGVVQQRGSVVVYDDLIVEDQVIVKPKLVGARSDVHVPQCRNELRAPGKPLGKPLCLPVNLGRPKVEIRRLAAET